MKKNNVWYVIIMFVVILGLSTYIIVDKVTHKEVKCPECNCDSKDGRIVDLNESNMMVKNALSVIDEIKDISIINRDFDTKDLSNKELLRFATLNILRTTYTNQYDYSNLSLVNINKVLKKYFGMEATGESLPKVFYDGACNTLTYNELSKSFIPDSSCNGGLVVLNTISKFVSAKYDEAKQEIVVVVAEAYSAPQYYDTAYYNSVDGVNREASKVFEIEFDPSVDDESKLDPLSKLESVPSSKLKNVRYTFKIENNNYILTNYQRLN